MRDRLQGAAAGGGGIGAVAIVVEFVRSHFAAERQAAAERAREAAEAARQAVEAASQEGMVELLRVMAERCTAG